MTIARSGHTATLLVDGKVLIVGGFDPRIQSTGNTSSSNLLNTELYDPIAKACAAAAPMITARAPQTIGCAPHSATLLMNTMVLIAGANHDGNDSELYNPAGDSWKPAGQMVVPRTQHTATLLKDGTVMVVGGTDGTNQLADTELFVSGQNSWSRAASLTTARARHTATLLPNGKVLVVGGVRTLKQGVDKDFFDHAFHIGYLASAELYDPVSKSWTATGTLNYPRADHTATLLPDEKVLVTGGQTYGEYDRVIEIDSAEIYDPGTTEWTESASMNTARTGHTATLLPGGQVLVAGGWDRAALSSVELYNPKTDTWSVCRSLNQGRYGQTATLLQDGGVLIAGGLGNYRPEQFTPLASTELFHLSGNRNP
jgi:N-acetylneuraminic acid mutarotase